jgi:PAS domain S-box-containing protein
MTKNQKTVLIVDGCWEDRENYRHYLQQDEEYTYRILQTELAQKALEMCEESLPEAILLNYILPDMTGLEFIQRLKVQLGYDDLPVVILIALGNEEIAITALKSGAKDYLIKEEINQNNAVRLRLAVCKVIEQSRLISQLKRTAEFTTVNRLLQEELTQHQRTEAALRESEKRFRLFADNLEAIIWIATPDSSQNFYVNKAYEKIWGRSCQSLRHHPKSWIEAVHPEDRKRVIAKLEQQKNGLLTNIEFRIIQPDGSFRWIWDRGFPILDEQGELNYYAGIAEDITERKQAEAEIRHLNETLELRVMERTSQLQTANNELEAFTYSVSHDLRAPLRSMQGFAEALAEDYGELLDELGHEYINRIINSARRLENLIEDLLAYSRLSRADLYLQPVNLDNVMFEVINLLENEISAKQAQVRIESPLPIVVAHRQTLARVITNLLSNALKFVQFGVQPQVLVWAEYQNQELIRLWVRDNGIGIKPEHSERIFRVFERLHGIERYPGTGIGLAIVRKGVERMGGCVGVESLPGQGSSFWIELKL